jgi:O-acetyl-ADP-ribose deacetylase (regulator of RNase III)
MSITYIFAGNLLDSGADLLIAPVCCVPGVMGAGLAKAFAERWPSLKDIHATAVKVGGLKPGGGFAVYMKNGPPGTPIGIYMIATKDHWKNPSQLDWVGEGLAELGTFLDRDADYTARWQAYFGEPEGARPEGAIRSVAVPGLGCGLGGLAWSDVRPLLVGTAELFPSIDWKIYLPGAEKGGGSNPRS